MATAIQPKQQQSFTDFILKLTSVEEGGLARVLESDDETILLKNFLDTEHSAESLLFWLEADAFQVGYFLCFFLYCIQKLIFFPILLCALCELKSIQSKTSS
jgi:hypothetical protein